MSRSLHHKAVAALAAVVLIPTALSVVPAAAVDDQASVVQEGQGRQEPIAAKPYLGWSSWSLQSTNYPGVSPDGPGSSNPAAYAGDVDALTR